MTKTLEGRSKYKAKKNLKKWFKNENLGEIIKVT